MVTHLLQPERHRALIHADGNITVLEAQHALLDLAEDPALRAGMYLMVDAQEWNGDWSPREVQAMLPAFRELGELGVTRTAFVVGCDVAYGMCRMFSAYLEAQGLEGEVFRGMENAEAWLKHPG